MNKLLMSKDKKTIKKVILYLLNSLGSKIEGKKKIMKLMFLLEHYDVDSGKITQKQLLGNDFYIYHYGVFSQGVMSDISQLIEKGLVKDGFPLTSNSTSEISPDKDLKERVDRIIQKFGGYSGYQLEIKTLEMLGIKPHEKGQYFGQSIRKILKQTQASN